MGRALTGARLSVVDPITGRAKLDFVERKENESSCDEDVGLTVSSANSEAEEIRRSLVGMRLEAGWFDEAPEDPEIGAAAFNQRSISSSPSSWSGRLSAEETTVEEVLEAAADKPGAAPS
jgi:hypothetical protein